MPLRSKIAALSLIPLTALAFTTLATTVPAGASTRTTTVKAVETDFKIALSVKTFKPGHYDFVAENKGQTTHALEITGPGLHDKTTKLLSPGQSAKLKVTFKKGKYDVFCPVPGHKALGMNVNLVVSTSGGSASSGGSVTGTTKAATGGYGY
jgi:uncharacterized cupredoxin-like copper-binding protein